MTEIIVALNPSPSFSRPRNPETAKPVERAGSATARLERQNTTINKNDGGGGPPSGGGANLTKANTLGSRPMPAPARPSPREGAASPPAAASPGGGGAVNPPTRGLSLRKPNTSPSPAPGEKRSPPPGGPGAGRGRGMPAGPNSRVTEIYDDYLEEYGNNDPEPPLPDDAGRVRQWAQKTLPGTPAGPSRAVSQRIPPSTYGSRSQYGGSAGGRRRGPGARPGQARSAAPSNFDGEEEEGYGSGDYEEAFELLRIKVKVFILFEIILRWY